LDPVVRALGMPRVNLFVAGDVGLGKTIETGLVTQELISRLQVDDDAPQVVGKLPTTTPRIICLLAT
ncbi:MAG: hypothetical protein M3P49_10395, partial [Actinomycetota bacterium]|nr:hypothetical protein [Actinomycetota bacterium]